MKRKYFLITIFSLVLSLISCSEDESTSSNDILSSKTWVIKSKMLSPSIVYAGVEITDITLFETDETKDYSFSFNSDGTLVVNDANNSVVLETTWELNSDETVLTFGETLIYAIPLVGDIGYSSIDIKSISSSAIVGTVTMPFEDEVYIVTMTFK
ncbi:hypothetical protein FPF71_14210 [Algibacter amylolyticus]|uniref:Lipocalin-like domain-containing protein n=1 Tax=Algibacter amylolyticus TaxID=1608400 RepID=A0A5M7AYI5_9FLAO|nr:hypothetical protein [Algibacter amylolyticus]KAA5822302.1 hypothetical protein F2B50_14210 [Algibacter amylolyticus]MBB5269014.1 hypothetical protein [Algibacter amylolyticus]TSJ73452.1 hypothetical protein FPF71_14210 [Algibacter amylolyticus]